MGKERIFLCYRRRAGAYVSGRIHHHLEQHFGQESVFKDALDLEGACDWQQDLKEALDGARVLLALIDEEWMEADRPEDSELPVGPSVWVQREIRAALEQQILVVPVLVGGAEMPRRADLPEDIRRLADRQAIRVRPDPDFDRDMETLIGSIEARMEGAGWNGILRLLRQRWPVAAAALVMLVVVLAVLSRSDPPDAVDVDEPSAVQAPGKGHFAIGDTVEDLRMTDFERRAFRLSDLVPKAPVDHVLLAASGAGHPAPAAQTLLQEVPRLLDDDKERDPARVHDFCARIGRPYGLLIRERQVAGFETLQDIADWLAESRGAPIVLTPWSPWCVGSVSLSVMGQELGGAIADAGARLIVLAGKYKENGTSGQMSRDAPGDTLTFMRHAPPLARFLAVYDGDDAVSDRFRCGWTCEFIVLDAGRRLRFQGPLVEWGEKPRRHEFAGGEWHLPPVRRFFLRYVLDAVRARRPVPVEGLKEHDLDYG